MTDKIAPEGLVRVPVRIPENVPTLKEAVRDLVYKKDAMQWRGNPKTMQSFLNSMEAALWSFHHDRTYPASEEGCVDREYRNGFSYSYIHFFTKLKAAFAYGIIMGLTRVRDGLVVNCKNWLITDEIAASGSILEAKWEALMYMIHCIRWMDDSEWANIEQSYIPHLRHLLVQFDVAYCHYERVLIPWLMQIEAHTRNFLSDIISSACDTDSNDSMHRFTNYVAQLNALCNKRGKGRSDLSYDEVQTAQQLLTLLDSAENDENWTNEETRSGKWKQPRTPNKCAPLPRFIEGSRATNVCREPTTPNPRIRPILECLINAFNDTRAYFVQLKSNLLCVDPQLSNNYQLRKHCERFESAWERVHALCSKERWRSVSTVFSFLEKHAGDLDCSTVEGALCIPRLLLLSSWEAPHVSPLFELFSPDVGHLMDRLRQEYSVLLPTTEDALVAVQGECAFMRALEDISIRLQRDHSNQWNQFLQLLHQSFDTEERTPKTDADHC